MACCLRARGNTRSLSSMQSSLHDLMGSLKIAMCDLPRTDSFLQQCHQCPICIAFAQLQNLSVQRLDQSH